MPRVALIAALLLLLAACRPIRHLSTERIIMQTEAPRTMDPADHTETYTTAVLDPMYEGLTRFNQQLQVVPALATEWHSSPDGVTWTVKLRPNVRFHDGTPFNSDAVLVSFRRMLDVQRGLAGASSIRRVLDSVRALDPLTVVFTLKAPFASFPGCSR